MMVGQYFGRHFSRHTLREMSVAHQQGASLFGLERTAEQLGFDVFTTALPFSGNQEQPGLDTAPLPAIIHWENNHFVVVYHLTARHVWIADPATGRRKLSHATFLDAWQPTANQGYALLLSPSETPATTVPFNSPHPPKNDGSIRRWLGYYRRLLIQIGIGVVALLGLQLLMPLVTQALVDLGISNGDLQFIGILLIAQLMLFGSQVVVQLLQGWTLLHLGLRLQIGLLNDFLQKVLQMPYAYFKKYDVGDFLQRIEDHERLEQFFTLSGVQILLGSAQFLIFGGLLLWLQPALFLIFCVGAALILGWILVFSARRKEVDYRRFRKLVDHQNHLLDLINGAADLKLLGNQAYHHRRWGSLQKRLFGVQLDSLKIAHWQDGGALALHQIKDVIITFVAARAVVQGHLTLGGLLAIQFMLGQLNVPLLQFSSLIRAAQDAQLSWQRIQQMKAIAPEATGTVRPPATLDFRLESVNFRYSPEHPYLLQNINIAIPAGKVTAIVGASGQGKSTLLKLLLGLLDPTDGTIFVGKTALRNLDKAAFRQNIGAVLQDAFVFSDTIENTICGSDTGNTARVMEVLADVQLADFVAHLPEGIRTPITNNGQQWSTGQRQRLLLARALYRRPSLLVLDEATNALDAATETAIQQVLFHKRHQRTTVLVAHRLSTIQHADHIVFLQNGSIVEAGAFEVLLQSRGAFYHLIRKQIGNIT